MKAAVVQGPGQVKLEEVACRSLQPGEVLVRMSCAAICGSDLHGVFGGYPPMPFPNRPGAPGHEGVGEVVESRSEQLAPGQRVLTVPDRPHAGAFAELQVLPERYALPVPSSIDPTVMVLAQQLGTVLFALEKFWPATKGTPPADAVAAVIGTGPAGLHFIRLLRERGFETIVAVDALEHRCASARRFGADYVVLADDQDRVLDEIKELTAGRGAELVVEAAGRNAARQTALGGVAKGGVVGLFGLPEGRSTLSVPYYEMFERQPSLVVSDGAQHEPGLRSFRRGIEDIAAHQSQVAELVSHVFPFDEFTAALALAHERRDEVRKVVVTFDDA